MYTQEGEVPLAEVFVAMKKKEEGKKVPFDAKKVDSKTLSDYLAAVLPTYDRERVYSSDIKKLITWYNILIESEHSDFESDIRKENEKEE